LVVQVSPLGSQLPQLIAGPPHPVGAVPQTHPAGQVVFGMHTPQTLVVPPPPHVSPAVVQLPHWSMTPQPSLIAPQFSGAHVFGMQHLLLKQVAAPSPGQTDPQSICPPQPSLIMPQLSPTQVFLVQTPHTLVVPEPPHVSPATVQLPQSSCLPQPSLMVPQLLGPQVLGVHVPQTLVVPPPPHVSLPTVQTPQFSWRPQPSLTVPQFLPCEAHVFGTQLLQTLSTQSSPSAHTPQMTGVPVQGLVTVPQFFPWRLHSPGGDAGLQTLLTQVSVVGQPLPHVRIPPQPSEIVPHSAPTASQVTRAQGLQVLVTASQTSPAPQAVQSISAPQPSVTLPHLPWQVFFTQSWHIPVAPLQI
jgi:hypothetical protein